MGYENFKKNIVNKIQSSFDKDRVICLLQYGPIIKSDGTHPKDFDFLLLLDKYNKNDYSVLGKIKGLNMPIEIFVDYKDHILLRGIANYQRGRHGSYFFEILSSAQVLIGDNFYKDNRNKLSKKNIRKDLLYRIEEYFYRIQKSLLNNKNIDKREIEKYISRIITDLLLVEKKINFQDVHKYHHTDITQNIINGTFKYESKTKKIMKKFISNNDLEIEVLNEIMGELYNKYFKLLHNE